MEQILNFIQSGTKYFPSFTAIVDKNGDVIDIQWNTKGHIDTKLRHHSHAEYLMLTKIKDHKEALLIQTMPPCDHCLKELEKLKIKIKIICLFDQWLKISRDTWKNSEYISCELLDRQHKDVIEANYILIEKRYNTHGHKRSKKELIKMWDKLSNIKN